MPAGDLITTDYQFEYAGVLFVDGAQRDLVEAVGFGLPEMRTSDTDRPRDHGMLEGADFLGQRTIEIELEILGTSAADLDAQLTALATMNAKIDATEQPLVWQFPSEGKRRSFARLRKRPVTVDRDYVFNVAHVRMQFVATDPRIYDNTQSSSPLTLPVASGGLGWPLGWPLGWGSSSGGFANVTNAGTFPTRPVVTFVGPLTSPNLQNVTTGLTWECMFDLQTGDTLVVDFDARTVLLNGTASRYSFVTAESQWWELVPGVNQLKLGASAGTGSATVAFRSAWI